VQRGLATARVCRDYGSLFVRSSLATPGIESQLGSPASLPIRVLLADPDAVSSRLISTVLEQEPDVTLARIDESELVSSIQEYGPDLVIVDAHASSIRRAESWEDLGVESPAATILTTYDSGSSTSFVSSATDLLIKPFDGERLEAALDLAKSRIVRKRIEHESVRLPLHEPVPAQYLQRLAVEAGDKIVLVRASEIEWIQSSGNYVQIHTANTAHLLRESLKNLQSQLDPRCFLRVHRNAIVNLDHVEEFHLPPAGNMFVKLRSGVSLPLRKSSRALLRKMLIRMS